jgi:guanine deaminase
MMKHKGYLERAIALACDNIENGNGPFGAVIVKNGMIIAEGTNQVTCNNDPTAHAEVQAIRAACKELKTFNLSGCMIYSSCEPCPMCFSAIYWAHIDAVYYAANKHDAELAGFDDAFIYREMEKPGCERSIQFSEITVANSTGPFKIWESVPDKIKY